MNWSAFATSHGEWPPHSPLPAGFENLPWLSPLDGIRYSTSVFSPPSSSTSIQPPILLSMPLKSFPTLAELLSSLLGSPTRPIGPIQLSEEHTRLATDWIGSHYQTVSDIPDREFDQYVKKWQGIADDILKANKVSKEARNAAKARIPRPCNVFFLFKNIAVGTLHNKLAGQLWRALQVSATGIRVWRSAANKLGQLHKDIFPDYKYTPVHTKKARSKIRTQTKSYKEVLTRGGKRRRAPKPPQLSRAPSDLSQDFDKPMPWPRDTDDNCGHGFPDVSQPEYGLRQGLQLKPFDFLPDFPGEGSMLFSIGTPSDDICDTYAGDIAFDTENWIREFNDSFGQSVDFGLG